MFRWTTIAICTLMLSDSGKGAETDPRSLQFFESKVRPLLVERCHRCHNAKKQSGELRLDTSIGLKTGGESGPVIKPGIPEASLLIHAVRYQSLEMPPDRRLPKSEVQILVDWVKMGAPFPGSDTGPITPRKPGLEVTDADRQFWSFQPLRRPEVPNDPDSTWDDDSPVDAFVLQKLNEHRLRPSPAAGRRQLVRRLYFDLIGLPPVLEDVERFESDDSKNAIDGLVDELLERPQYGERWARHWLDVVRFAQTNGYERDDEKPESWRYRDYVVRALNEDKPYDQFVTEQLAGDELEDVSHDSIIATGFYRIGVWDDEPDDKVQAVYDELDDILRTTGEAFLGLTIGCARCHDHKFDPIPQADYYRMLSLVRNVAPYGKDKSHTHWEMNSAAVFTPLLSPESVSAWEQTRADLREQIAAVEVALKSAGDRQRELEKQRSDLKNRLAAEPFERALTVRELTPKPPETRLLIRGSHLTPGDVVEPAFLTVIGSDRPTIASTGAELTGLQSLLRGRGVGPTSGRRRALAEWIASPEHPLTARVIVNRLWHYHFGRGIVATPNDFGRTGVAPTHPELLDWLASELISSGWSLKHIHRLILNSRTWQQASVSRDATDEASSSALDPGNRWLWRQNLRRLEAEAVRDSMLAVSGKLNLESGGRGFFPQLSREVLATQSRSGSGWETSDERQRSRRSIYIFIKRTLGVPFVQAFDMPVPDRPEPNRQTTTIAPQALILLNSDFTQTQAEALAARLIAETDGSDAAAVEHAYRLALGRSPSSAEVETLHQFLSLQRELIGDTPDAADKLRHQSFVELARLMFNLNEFIYVD